MGYFITLEGTDGSGKSTQLNLLKKHFEKTNYNILFTREPGGTPLAEKIRNIIIDKNNNMNSYTEVLLYAAARCEHVNNVIQPFLDEDGIVISDRFLDSSIAYQGHARNIPIEDINIINSFATNALKPDLTFFLDLPPSQSIKRRMTESDPDRIEAEGQIFQGKVYEGFKRIIEMEPERFIIIDGTLEIKEIHEIILKKVLLKIK